jgi:ethanolamine utilization protein EutQ
MSQLICAKDVEVAVRDGKKVICADRDAIITPSAKDIAAENDIEISRGDGAREEGADRRREAGDALDSDLIYNVLKVLAERGDLAGVLPGVRADPCRAETDPIGIGGKSFGKRF